MTKIYTLIAALALATPALAQPTTSTSRFEFNQDAVDLAEANTLTYRLYTDGAAQGVTMAVTCTGASSPFTCTSPVGAFSPGSHIVAMTAANLAGESVKSAPITFVMVLIPNPPAGLRIVPK